MKPMKIKTYLLSDFPAEKTSVFIEQIAHWHYNEWGKYKREIDFTTWHENIIASLKRGTKIIIAVDENQNLVGSVSLKQTNMDNLFPTFTPWLSGLYVEKNSRGKQVSTLLMQKLTEEVKNQKSNAIYVFTHDLSLENYYKKFGWEIMHPLSGEHYIYKNAPILLFKGDVETIFKIINKSLHR